MEFIVFKVYCHNPSYDFFNNNPYLKLYKNRKNIGLLMNENLKNKKKLQSGKQIEALEVLLTLKRIYEGIAAVATTVILPPPCMNN